MLPAPDLRRLSIFSGLAPEAFDALQGRLIYREVAPGGLILPRGVCANLLAGVASGQVVLQTELGYCQSLGPGDWFGQEMLLHGAPSRFEVRAGTDGPVGLWLLPRAAWLAVRSDTGLAQQASARPYKTPPAARSRVGLAQRASVRPQKRLRGALVVLIAGLLAVAILGRPLVIAGGSTLALRLFDEGRFTQANRMLDLALSLQPDSAMLHDSYGTLLYLQGDAAAAAVHLHRAADLDPGLAAARHNLGVLLLAQGDPAGAIQNFEAVITLDPGNALAYRNLGDAYLQAGRRSEAARAYARAWSLDPALLEARARWAALILDENRPEDARRAWQEVLSRQPEHPDAQLGLGALDLIEGQPADALPHLQAARLTNPADALTRLYLGLTLQALDRPAEAIAEFEQALALSRDPAGAGSALADVARRRLMELRAPLSPVGEAVEGGGKTADP